MRAEQILDRFAKQIESLQQGFEILARASTVKDLAQQFFHLLHGSLTTVEAHIFYRPAAATEWQCVYGKGEPPLDALNGIGVGSGCILKALEDKKHPLLVTQSLIDKSFVAVLLGPKLAGKAYSDLDHISLRVFLQLFANAYQAMLHRQKEKGLIFSLNHRLLQLSSLIDTGIEISSPRLDASLYMVALQRAAALTNASRGVATIAQGSKIQQRISFPDGTRLRRPAEKTHRIRSTFKFAGLTHAFELVDKESRAGTGPFEETDQMLLDALSRQVHAALENRHLQAQEIEKQKLDRDIKVAADIQQRILPKILPTIEGYDLAGVNIPTKFVGGDYYDCIPLKDGKYALIMADVAGKGIPAALLVSSFHAYLSAYLESSFSLDDLTRRLNAVIYRASTEERYITAALALFDPASGEITTINAGHTAIYLHRKSGTIEELNNGGLALGMLDMELPYTSDTVTIERGERFLLYTDGVTEAMNTKQQLYDTDGSFKKFFREHHPQTAQAFIDALLADIERFTDSAPQADDITAMCLVRK
ncbi:MAG: PP2C family protein-serine/threonine phosphatase [Bacteroidota bacterium]